jgi:hypothetical protein
VGAGCEEASTGLGVAEPSERRQCCAVVSKGWVQGGPAGGVGTWAGPRSAAHQPEGGSGCPGHAA